MIEELNNLMRKNNVLKNDQQKIIAGFKAIPYNQRQLIFGALKAHPELVSVFINLMNRKIDLMKNPTKEKEDSIVEEEEKILKDALKEIE